MSAALEKSLDEIIGEKPKSGRRGTGGPTRSSRPTGPRDAGRRSGGGGGGGGGGRNPGRIASTPYSRDGGRRRSRSRSRSQSPRWVHDRADTRRGNSRSRGNGPRDRAGASGSILITNLQYEIDQSALEHIFDAVGRISRINLISDRAGRSAGKCYIDYERKQDALEAVRQFDDRICGGLRIRVELAAPKKGDLGSRLRFADDDYERPSGRGRGNGGRGDRQGADGGRGERRGRKENGGTGNGNGKRERRGPATAEQLDAELDAYLNAKNTSKTEAVSEPAAHGDAEGMQVD